MAMTLRRLLSLFPVFVLYGLSYIVCSQDACLDSIDIKPVYMVPMSFKIFRVRLSH
ncbi:hypothetical protein YC2023_015045 [Brassica napus]